MSVANPQAQISLLHLSKGTFCEGESQIVGRNRALAMVLVLLLCASYPWKRTSYPWNVVGTTNHDMVSWGELEGV